jgi:hypothetical protein
MAIMINFASASGLMAVSSETWVEAFEVWYADGAQACLHNMHET